MPVEKKPFVPYRDQDERDQDKSQVSPIRFNKKEIEDIEEGARILREYQLTTTVKKLIMLGLSVLHQPSTGPIIDLVIKNDKRNIKKNVDKLEPKFWKL